MEKELHEFLTESHSERLEMRVRRMVEWRIWWEKVLGRTFPMREKSCRLQWPDVPEAEKERFCEDWRCRKKGPAGRLVCPWCGRFERITDFDWMDVLDALYMPRETVYMGNGICRTVTRNGGTILEQYTRISAEPLELSAEIKVELPAETMRKYLDALGVTGDS